ncbi:GvpL/GvpF family gas vesicle protein [Streptomyces sp. 11-1-2]|uniref:GvpL/GvpF family gas vesicle protein n=1 Tax=unclassified Streptomyces TaxID=2593676 RepID=UPI000B8DB20B|nr:GvpL/GvpF family gas vesicle protein [Streptomyces sp. 11-1-2]ASQ98628.1 gas vesicle protein [Streptomyces sp. 11-1-2]
MTDSLATWLYAVTAAPEGGTPPQGLTGVADEPVRLVEKAGLAAVVGSVPLEEFDEDALRGHLEDLEWLERTARAHHRVINGVARQGQVIPLRFATLYHDDDRVRAMLQERREDFAATLRRVAGRTEWGVKAYVDPRSFLPDPDEPAGGEDSPGTAYLLRRRAQRQDQETAHLRATERAEEIHASLAALAVATAAHPPQDTALAAYEGWMVLNNSYLVPDGLTEEFTALVTALGERCLAFTLEVSGPWPPYSFTAPPKREGQEGQEGEARPKEAPS